MSKIKGKKGERVSIYLPEEIAEEIKLEAVIQGRSLSWVIRQSWKVAKQQVEKLRLGGSK